MGGNVTAAYLTYLIMKTTKDIVLSCLIKMACEFFYKATHADTYEEFEINYTNFQKASEMKETIEKGE